MCKKHFSRVCIMYSLPFTTGKRDEWDPDLKCQVALYFERRQSSSELGSLISKCVRSSKICISSDTLAITYDQRVVYSSLVTCGDGGLKQLWGLIHGPNSPLMARGLLAVNLHDSVIVWCKGKPLDLKRVTGKLNISCMCTRIVPITKTCREECDFTCLVALLYMCACVAILSYCFCATLHGDQFLSLQYIVHLYCDGDVPTNVEKSTSSCCMHRATILKFSLTQP